MEKTTKIYKIRFQEFDKDEEQVLEVKTKDIKFTMEQIGRNRPIETMDVKEIKLPSFDNDDV
jgi:hypothetical protein